MLHVGLDLRRKRFDVCLISGEGELVEHFRAGLIVNSLTSVSLEPPLLAF